MRVWHTALQQKALQYLVQYQPEYIAEVFTTTKTWVNTWYNTNITGVLIPPKKLILGTILWLALLHRAQSITPSIIEFTILMEYCRWYCSRYNICSITRVYQLTSIVYRRQYLVQYTLSLYRLVSLPSV